MPIGFHKECCFCSNEELQPTPPKSTDRLWRLVCLRNYICPHCFDIFRRPVRPTLLTLIAWFGLYVGSYFVVSNPSDLVRYQWPDERTQVMRQFVYAPMMHFDPRVREEQLSLESFQRAIQETEPHPVSVPAASEVPRTRLATLPESKSRM